MICKTVGSKEYRVLIFVSLRVNTCDKFMSKTPHLNARMVKAHQKKVDAIFECLLTISGRNVNPRYKCCDAVEFWPEIPSINSRVAQ